MSVHHHHHHHRRHRLSLHSRRPAARTRAPCVQQGARGGDVEFLFPSRQSMLTGRARRAYTRLLYLAREHYTLLVTESAAHSSSSLLSSSSSGGGRGGANQAGRSSDTNNGHESEQDDGIDASMRLRRSIAMERVRRAFRTSLNEQSDRNADSTTALPAAAPGHSSSSSSVARERIASRADGSDASSHVFSDAISRAEYVIREIEALVSLHKYRAMKRRYSDTHDSSS